MSYPVSLIATLGEGRERRLSFKERWTLPFRVAIFLALGGTLWWLSNEFSVAEPIGFDPLRYEYFARNGLPQAFSDSSSFRMVVLLEYIYKILPEYAGYLIFIGALCFLLIRSDPKNLIHLAVSSPISFYYLCQTGKDGIAILALCSTVLLAQNLNNYRGILVGVFIISLSFFVRPAIGLLLPITFIQFRYGTFWSILLIPFMLYAFSIVTDTYQVLNTLEGLTGDEGAGQMAIFLRQYTFGYDNIAIFYKVSLLITSFVFQPALGLLKYISGSSHFVIFEALCFAAILFNIIRRGIIVKFLISSLPYVLIIGATSPFYHFRYLAVTYPIIYLFCITVTGLGWTRVKWQETDGLETRVTMEKAAG